MQFSLCNEVIADNRDFAAQCTLAAGLGYAGLEVAPFTLGDEPHRLSGARRTALRRAAADAGLVISGLHWLLVTPKGLSITDPDPAVRRYTSEVVSGLVTLCADLGGRVLVHGSPKQRNVAQGDDPLEARKRALDVFATAARAAEQAGVTYCLEPLAPRETAFINTVAEAAAVVEEIGSPAFRTMLDTSAAGLAEARPVADVLRNWLPTGMIAHIQLNDTNRRAPGQGHDAFAPILFAMRNGGFSGLAAVEPFVYHPDGVTTAARAIGYLYGVLAGLDAAPARAVA